MTNGILQSLKFKNKLYLDMKATKPETVKYNSLKFHLQAYNSLLKIVRYVKFDNYTDRFNKNSSNIRHTWATV